MLIESTGEGTEHYGGNGVKHLRTTNVIKKMQMRSDVEAIKHLLVTVKTTNEEDK